MRILLGLFLLLAFAGCKTQPVNLTESKVDAKVAGQGVPISSPNDNPGEPQKGFAQEHAGQ